MVSAAQPCPGDEGGNDSAGEELANGFGVVSEGGIQRAVENDDEDRDGGAPEQKAGAISSFLGGFFVVATED